MRVYEMSGTALVERAAYSSEYRPEKSDLLVQLNALVGRRDELFTRLRRYLSERPEPAALRNGQ